MSEIEKITVREYLKDNILLFDGAMGSYFASIHDDPEYPCEYANITAHHTISEIHKRYLTAGAKAIKTNTFSLSPSNDAPFSNDEIIKSAYKLAKQQADTFNAYVFCDITISLAGEKENLLDWHKSIIDIFLEVGGENFLFETCYSSDYLNELAEYIKGKLPEAFIITSFASGADGFTKTGKLTQTAISEIGDKVDVVGLNCICGPYHMRDLVSKFQFNRTISAMPNASYPTVLGNRMTYGNNPTYFADEMIEIAKNGCSIIGGCCGTTPEFISILHNKLESLKLSEVVVKKPVVDVCEPSERPIVKSDFYEKLKSGKKPIAVEWDSPATPEITSYMAKAKILKEAGVDLITIADCPVARPRMDSSLVACKLKRELGLNAMPHMTCRDRNINACKALLLGLSVEEVNNVLIITGDPIPQEKRQEIKSVYEFNSRMLIHNISSLNQTLFENPFYLYGALNINAVNFDAQLKQAKEKIENGAVAFFTQPVLSERGYNNLKRAKEELNVPLVGGIFPPVSYRNIWFLTNEISGFHVAPEISERYKDKTPEECSKLAVEISIKVAKGIKDIVDGFYIITPFQRVDLITEILKEIENL